jgi:hypothetical protein
VQKYFKKTRAVTFAFLSVIAFISASIQPAAGSDGSFSIIWVTDTQYLSESNPQLNYNLSRWIVNNAALYNLKMVVHTGDLVNAEGNMTQWENANQSMGLLLDNDIPYCWNAGNHDFTTSYYIGNQYDAFNPQVFASKPYFVDSKYGGMNTAAFFNVSGWECLIVNISFDANDAVLEWTNNLLDQYQNAHAIVATHAYLDRQGDYGDWAANLKSKTLDTHANVFLVLGGHYYPTQGVKTRVGERDEMLFNQQDANNKQGAASARILTLNPANGTIMVQTFSVYLNQFICDENNDFMLYTSFRNNSVNLQDFPLVWLGVIGFVVFVCVFSVFLIVRRVGRSGC